MSRVCEESVRRLAEALPGREVAVLLLREANLLVHVAHEGSLRLIFEVPEELGGVVWRAIRLGAVQVVPDVAGDPDYVVSDDSVTSEIAAPVRVEGEVVGALDVESTRPIVDGDATVIAEEAERLAAALAAFYRSS